MAGSVGDSAPAPDKAAALAEAYKRGILPPAMKGAYEEALKRGLVKAGPEGTAPNLVSQNPRNRIDVTGEIIPKARESIESGAKRFKSELDYQRGMDPTAEVGTDTTDVSGLSRADNEAEQRAYLEKRYGAKSVGKDDYGLYVITPSGKKAYPGAQNVWQSILGGAAGQAPVIAGATLGGVLGGPGGAALGGAGGKALMEGMKTLGGVERKTLPQAAESVGKEGVLTGVGEGVGKIVTGAPGAAGSTFRKYLSGTTPEDRMMTNQVMQSGGTPPLSSVVPSAKRLQWWQDLSTRVLGSFTDEKNRAAVEGRLRAILHYAGLPDAEIQSSMGQILDPSARLSANETGRVVKEGVQFRAAAEQANVENLARDADATLTRQLGLLNAQGRRSAPGALGEDVAGGIAQARKDFSTSVGKIYKKVDDIVGGIPVVPTIAMKREAKRVLGSLPKDAQGNPVFGDPQVLQSLQRIAGLGDYITLSDGQQIRSTLAELGGFKGLTPGVNKRQFEQLRTAADVAIGNAAKEPLVAPAIGLLRTADKVYADGIRKFQDATVTKLVNDARTGVIADPSTIASTVLQPGFTQRAVEIKKMVGDGVWRRVAAADFKNLTEEATDSATREIDARKLANGLAERQKNGLLDITYGPKLAGEIRQWTERVAARNGKIPAVALQPDTFGQTMRRLEQSQAELDAFMKDNYIAALSKPGKAADSAISYILRPGQEDRLVEAFRYFGSTGPEVEAIRKQALKEVLNSAIVNTQSGTGRTVAGDGLVKALGQYTRRQQDLLFPGGLADDMRLLAKEVKFLFPKTEADMSAGLAAGGIKMLPTFAYVPVAGGLGAIGYILSRPSLVSALANGLRDSTARNVTREAIMSMFRAGAAGTLPEIGGDETPQTSPEDVAEKPDDDGNKRIISRRTIAAKP